MSPASEGPEGTGPNTPAHDVRCAAATGGLSARQAAARLERDGPNSIPPPPLPLWRRLARQLADPLIVVLLADDDLDTVVAAVEEGRRVFANIRRFLIYGLSGGAAEITVMLLGPAFGSPLFLLPAQILWIDLLTHGLPGVALGGEPSEPGVMERPPRPPSQSILAGGLWQRVVRISLVLSALTFGVAVWADHTGRPWKSMAFFALGAAQLGVAIGSRARPGTWANPLLPIAVAAALSFRRFKTCSTPSRLAPASC